MIKMLDRKLSRIADESWWMMVRLEPTTRLNMKVIGIMSVFMLIVMVFSLWMSLQERKRECTDQMQLITEFLVRKMPADSFNDIARKQGAAGKSLEEQVIAVNKELQPILANVLVPMGAVKFGIYSRGHHSNVAIGPVFDSSLLLADVDSKKFETMYATDMAQLGESKKSIVWYGAPAYYHIRPISNNGQIIGHAFAVLNLDMVYAEFWGKAMKALGGGVVALLIVIILFQETFIRLKKELVLFAEAIVNGRAKYFESKIPELTPVLQYISEQTENMARLDRLNLIGEMAASIGHEVRNPMTTVRGFLQYLSQKEEFKKSQEHFVLMIEELDRANSIITEFLSLAKNKSMDFQEINLNNVIMEVAPLIQADAIRFNCQVEINLGVIPAVRIDENSMRQLILNMVRNGIEAMPRGGMLKISTVDCAEKVLLFVQDEGVGIPAEILDKLGTPFVTTKENGVGLGLAVCYRIAHRHEATIDVESAPGKGTIFMVGFTHLPGRD